MLRTAISVGVLGGVVAISQAADWEQVYASSVGTVKVDRSTLSRDGPLVTTWLQIELRKPDTLGGVAYDKRSTRVAINCDTRQYQMTSESLWLRGKLVKNWEGGPSEDFDVDPDKPLKEVAGTLCR